MVVALPIKNSKNNVNSHNHIEKPSQNTKSPNKEIKMVGNFPVQEFTEDSGIKQCSNCGACHDSQLNSCPACKHQYN